MRWPVVVELARVQDPTDGVKAQTHLNPNLDVARGAVLRCYPGLDSERQNGFVCLY